jgi:putative FmdB family regulatory protein
MPIYEYHCERCEKIIEQLQKFSDPPLAACPQCQSPVTKVISKTSFQLKGTGWYASDYKKSASAPAPAPDAASPEKKTETPAAASTGPIKTSEGKESK